LQEHPSPKIVHDLFGLLEPWDHPTATFRPQEHILQLESLIDVKKWVGDILHLGGVESGETSANQGRLKKASDFGML